MENKTVFIKVFVKDELPIEDGFYDTDQGNIYSSNFTYYGTEWWLKEIELPSEKDIEGMSSFYDAFESEGEDKYSSYKIGANYILNKLK